MQHAATMLLQTDETKADSEDRVDGRESQLSKKTFTDAHSVEGSDMRHDEGLSNSSGRLHG